LQIKLSKIHGLGNDFIVINELAKEIVKDKAAFAKKFCRRAFAVGADGVLFLKPSKMADFRMQVINSDGSEAETCVNGLRCVAFQKFLLDGKKKKKYSIETLQGLVEATIESAKGNLAEVCIEFLGKIQFKGRHSVEVDGGHYEYFFVDVGNPHAVIFLQQAVKDFPVEAIGHKIEYHEKFAPSRTNTEFVNVLSQTEVNMRVHERGACETKSCGSGSIAIVVAGVNAGLLSRNEWVSVNQPGGTLKINFGEKLLLKGAAEKVFEGTLEE
jgi:diaminopimelate epimerase